MKIFSKQKFMKDGKLIKKYKFCGITLLRKEKSPTKKKWNLLGVKASRKNQNYLLKNFNNEYKLRSSDYKLITESKYWDNNWYLEHNPDVKTAMINPIEHYLTCGWKECRQCSPYFDANLYLQMYPDVANANINPLLHYLLYGKHEKRQLITTNQSYNTSTPIIEKTYKNHFFSIIVASYNYQNFITETLDSLVSQTYKNFEVIIVDDGSTDNSVKIIETYVRKYPFIKLFQHQNCINKGLPETVLLGVQQAKGEYIAFCESDDYWHPEHLFEINNKINSENNVQIIVNDVETFGDEKRCSDMAKVIEHRKREIISSNGLISDEKFAISNYILTFSACCVCKDLLLTCNFTDVPKQTALDWWLWRQICYQNQIFYINKKLTYWRLHLSYNIRDVIGQNEKHTEFVEKLNKIMYKRKYDSIYKYNGKLSDIDCFQILELKAKRESIINKIKNGNFRDIKICYISTTSQVNRPIGDGSVRYRCYHPAEVLSSLGAFVTIVPHTIFIKNLSYHYDLYIFHRPCQLEKSIIYILKKMGKIIIADYDDLIFGNQYVAKQSSLYKNLNVSLEQITQNFLNNTEALMLFDFISVSTERLAKEVLRNNPIAKVSVIHNFIPDSILRLSNELNIRKQPKDKNLLMYCTGTLSHNLDFAQIEDTLLFCLERDHNLKLIIFGVLSASEKLQKIGRVFFHKPVDYWNLFDCMSPIAFTMAPLERPSLFNECKSNVKFLESSVAGNTLFATPIQDMRRVKKANIKLCSTNEDWKNVILNRNEINLQQNIKQNFEYLITNCSTNTFIDEFKNMFAGMEI